MHISVENKVIFESYLSNSLSQEERTAFDSKLSADSHFKMQFEEFKRIEKGVKHHFHRNHLKTKFAEIDAKIDEQSSIGKINYLKWFIVAGAAASIVLFATLTINNSKSETYYKELVAQNWPHEEGLPVKMSNGNVYDDAMNSFKMEDWDEAERKLQKMKSDTATYFLGVIAFEKENIKSAAKYFKQVEKTSIYHADAQFRLALISILNKNWESAKHILKDLETQNSEYSVEARKVLEQI